MRIPQEKIEAVRDRADIEKVIGRSIRLEKKGHRLVGLCPFHKEKTPSFSVSREKQLYYCFGCQAGGNVFDFIMHMEGLDFAAAVRALAKEFGVELPEEEESPGEKAARSKRARLYEVNQLAAELYERCLGQDEPARRYLLSDRGLKEETIQHFRLGWAPNEWSTLTDQLAKKQVDPELPLELGLMGKSLKEGRLYDRLRGRVVFPILIPGGSIAGFGARRADWVDPDGPKYLNSPESQIYDKSSLLYGLYDAKDEIRKSRRAVLVEGYLDVISLHQAGFTMAVAGCGTALTPKHAATLARLTREVVTLYDGDTAGQEATRKSAELLLGEGVAVRVVDLPEGEDPDTFVQKEGAETLKKLIDEAPSAIDFFVARAKARFVGGGIAGTTSAVEAVKPMILALKDPLERDVTIQATAKVLGIEARALERHLGAPRSNASGRPNLGNKPKTRAATVPVVERAILRMVIEAPAEVLPVLEEKGAFVAISHMGIRAAIEGARRARSEGTHFDTAKALELAAAQVDDEPELMNELQHELMKEQPEREDLSTVVTRLMKKHFDDEYADIKRRLAEETDATEAERLLAESARIKAELKALLHVATED